LRPHSSGAILSHARSFDIEIAQTRHKIDVRDHASALLKKQPHRRDVLKGYPVPLNTKKRDCLVAYSHSARKHFENAFCDMIKSKYFMTVLRAIVTKTTATGRFDSARFFNPLLSSYETTLACARAQSHLPR
jgi:hypothetical protein